MSFFDNPEYVVAVATGLIAFSIWLVRLEGRVNRAMDVSDELRRDVSDQENELSSLRAHQETTDGRIADELKTISNKLAHIEGYLTAKKQNRNVTN